MHACKGRGGHSDHSMSMRVWGRCCRIDSCPKAIKEESIKDLENNVHGERKDGQQARGRTREGLVKAETDAMSTATLRVEKAKSDEGCDAVEWSCGVESRQ